MNQSCEVSLANYSLSQSSKAATEYYISGPLMTAVIAFGVLGNLVSVKALHGRRMPSINSYLIVLAFWDLVLISTSFFLYSLTVLISGHVLVYGAYVRTFPAFFTLTNAAHAGSIWCVVAMAAERYYALCHPLRHHAGDQRKRVRRTLICLSAAALLLASPRFFEVNIVECLDVDSGRLTPSVVRSGLRRHNVYSLVYLVIGGLLFYSLAPFALLLILSVRVIAEVRRGAKLRRHMSMRGGGGWREDFCRLRSDKTRYVGGVCPGAEQHQLQFQQQQSVKSRLSDSAPGHQHAGHHTETLPLAVVGKFLICYFMPTVLDICERLMGEEEFVGPTVDVLVDLSNFLVVLNSSVNVLVYAACSARFRRNVVRMFLCRRRRRFQESLDGVSSKYSSVERRSRLI